MLRRRCEGLGSAHSAEDGSLKGIKSLTCFDSTMFYPSFQLSVPQGLKLRGFGGAKYQEISRVSRGVTWSHPRQGPGPEKSKNECCVATWHDHDPAWAFGAKDNYLVVSTLQLGFCMTLYVEGRPKPVRLSAPSRHSQPFFEGRCSIAFILNGLHIKHVQLQSCF